MVATFLTMSSNITNELAVKIDSLSTARINFSLNEQVTSPQAVWISIGVWWTVGKSDSSIKRYNSELHPAIDYLICYGCCNDNEEWWLSRLCGLPILVGVYERYNHDYPWLRNGPRIYRHREKHGHMDTTGHIDSGDILHITVIQMVKQSYQQFLLTPFLQVLLLTQE